VGLVELKPALGIIPVMRYANRRCI
jgi:hypothetical protein